MLPKFISAEAKELAFQLDLLRTEFLNTADWRRQKAIEHPDDKRNEEAAQLLERLATTVEQVEAHLIKAFYELREDSREAEEYSEMLRKVGFHWGPKTATEFVRDFIGRTTSGRRSRA
jgi:hypothetical protein